MSQPSAQQMMELMQSLMRQVTGIQDMAQQHALLEAEVNSRKEITDGFALISETDTRGVITYANPRFCEVSGYTLEELIGKPHNVVRHPDMPKEVFKELWDTIKAGKIWQGEIKNRCKDGSHYWVLATVGPIFDENGEISSYVSMRVDITAQKDLELALKKEREELKQVLNDLESNLRFAFNIQSLLMPPLETPENSNLPYFIIWRPLSYVSGDFVYIHEDKNRFLFFIGDSIGHGVSGGFVSTLFIQELRHLVEEKGIWSPELLAEELDSRLGRLFAKRLLIPLTVDGAIALIDLNRKRLHYLALNRKNFLYKDGEITALPEYPFSFGEYLGQSAQETIMDLPKGSRLYLFTDGVSDQKKNGESKRWGQKGWREFLQSLQSHSLSEQKSLLEKAFAEAKAQGRQTDDMLVVGIEMP
jgi:PAS domain S-box-containing protein